MPERGRDGLVRMCVAVAFDARGHAAPGPAAAALTDRLDRLDR